MNKNRKFAQKSKIWPKIENLAKNRKFDQKSKNWEKIKISFLKKTLKLKCYQMRNFQKCFVKNKYRKLQETE